jgi:1-phosphofructokinase family hexose kinase
LYAGGKGNNVARALKRLGLEVTATGFQGGYTGDFCTQNLRAEGIQTAFTPCRVITRTSQLIIEDETGAVFPIYEPGQTVEADETETLIESVNRLLQPGAVCLLCGSAVVADAYARLITLADQRGVRCLLDSSGQTLKLGIAAKPYLVKVNADELGEYIGHKLADRPSQVRALQETQASGIPLVAVSLGAEGLLASNGAAIWLGTLPMPNVVNTVGCGDSLLAGMTLALIDGADLPEIVRWGVACGAANTQVIGSGFIEHSTVEGLLPKVNLERIL